MEKSIGHMDFYPAGMNIIIPRELYVVKKQMRLKNEEHVETRK